MFIGGIMLKTSAIKSSENGNGNGDGARRLGCSQIRFVVADGDEPYCNTLRSLLDNARAIDAEPEECGAIHLFSGTQAAQLADQIPGPDRSRQRRAKNLSGPELPVTVVLVPAHCGEQRRSSALPSGAYVFLSKPVEFGHLLRVVRDALAEYMPPGDAPDTAGEVVRAFRAITTRNARMLATFEMAHSIADTTSTVLIEGETGTGKELFARAIHQMSSRQRSGPMVAVNCAALPETLLESELFGHEIGAFTGAVAQRVGRFEQAHKGTLLLDEIGEISPAVQVKLLRVLQERCFERIGGMETIEVDVRVIVTTNRPLERLVRRRRFRPDLFYRLNVIRIELPPLRERREDIPLLAGHFVEKYARPGEAPRMLSPEALELLAGYSWPGNIRELENVIERACVTSHEEVLLPDHLQNLLTGPLSNHVATSVDVSRPLHDVVREATADLEREYLCKLLRQTHGNVTRCAALCGLSRRSITAKLAELQIDRSQFQV